VKAWLPFLVYELRPNNLLYLGEVSIPQPQGQGAKATFGGSSLSLGGTSLTLSLGESPIARPTGKHLC
jgi:hypothetical protein